MSKKMTIRMIKINKILPNPFQPRESFPKNEIQELANTIEKFGLLQPISVRKKGTTYQIISGERRWRAAQFAGLKEIPAIVKDIDDSRLMVESLIENVHRKDLEPLEKARGLAEVYRLAGIDPDKALKKLMAMDRIVKERREEELTKDEERIKELADMVGLSYNYQYLLLKQLALTPEEQERASELKLDYGKTSAIATIDEPEIRKKVIEIAPELKRAEVKKVTKLVKRAPRRIVKAVLEKEISPVVAEEIAKIEEPEIVEDALEIARKGVYSREEIEARIQQLIAPRIELPKEPIEVQIFNKTMWNLGRIEKRDFYTTGYEMKTPQQFLELLEKAGVRTVVDVRAEPRSVEKEEFDKEGLERLLKGKGIEYKHFPSLGVPPDAKKRLEETGDFKKFFRWYDNNVLKNGPLDSKEFETLEKPIAIMCMKFDPTKCYRHRIALALEKKGLKGFDM
ncbi:MAG: ParB/RepB/Spo0J family partition protein [Candidatus Hodarchaeota archaeon]